MMPTRELPTILVVARSDAHHGWRQSLGERANYLTMEGRVYGRRYDLILIDLDPADLQRERTQLWLEQEVATRLNPNGKLVYVR